MKPVNALILRRFGFRRVLLVNGALAIASLAAIGLFRADTSHLVIYAVLFLGGWLWPVGFLPDSIFWLFAKISAIIFFFFWIRSSSMRVHRASTPKITCRGR